MKAEENNEMNEKFCKRLIRVFDYRLDLLGFILVNGFKLAVLFIKAES